MNETIQKKSRRRARKFALQAIYQWQINHDSDSNVIKQFIDEHDMGNADLDYFNKLVSGTIQKKPAIDEYLAPLCDRELSRLNPVELAVLRVAAFELMDCSDVPYRVVINEALELAKEFGSEQGHKYVNGVLDKLAPTLRKLEFNN